MRDVILTDRGPKPIGPYSQAIRTNGFLCVSGQVALDPKTGEMTGPDIGVFLPTCLRPLCVPGKTAYSFASDTHATRRPRWTTPTTGTGTR